MEKLDRRFKYECIEECNHWGGKVWRVGDIVSSLIDVGLERKECFKPIELTLKERFEAMRKSLNLTYADIANITGNTTGSIKSVINSGKIPNWAKFSIWWYETGQYQNPLLQKMMQNSLAVSSPISGKEKENEV